MVLEIDDPSKLPGRIEEKAVIDMKEAYWTLCTWYDDSDEYEEYELDDFEEEIYFGDQNHAILIHECDKPVEFLNP